MTKLYEVQEFTVCDGWVNNWRHTQDGSGKPMQFTSYQGAFDELEAYILESKDDYHQGYLVDYPEIGNFRIVEVT